MKKIYLIGLIVCVVGACVPEPDGPAPEDVFVKYYGRQGANTAKDIVVTSTGEFIILGSQIVEGGSGSNFYLIRADQEGNLIDSDTLGYLKNDDVPSRIKAISDTEFLVIGTSTNPDDQSRRLIYARVGENLNITSNHGDFFAVSPESGLDLDGADIIQVQGDNNETQYILLGTMETAGSGTEIFISKRDTANNLTWTEDEELGYSGSDDRALALFEKSDGNLVIVGSTGLSYGAFGGTNIYVAETNRYAEEISALITGLDSAGDNADDIPYSVIPRSSNSYMNVGSTATENGTMTSFQLEVSGSAGKITEHLVKDFRNSGQELDNQAYAVTRTHLNEFIIVGKYQNFNLDGENKLGEMMVLRTSQLGKHIPEADQHYGLVSGDDEANAVVTTADGDVVVAATVDFGSGIRLIGLLKLNEFGELKD